MDDERQADSVVVHSLLYPHQSSVIECYHKMKFNQEILVQCINYIQIQGNLHSQFHPSIKFEMQTKLMDTFRFYESSIYEICT